MKTQVSSLLAGEDGAFVFFLVLDFFTEVEFPMFGFLFSASFERGLEMDGQIELCCFFSVSFLLLGTELKIAMTSALALCALSTLACFMVG